MARVAKTKADLEEENDALRMELAGVADSMMRVEDLNRKLTAFAGQIKEQRDRLFMAIRSHHERLQHPTKVDTDMYGVVVEIAHQIAERKKRCERVCKPVNGKCHGDCVLGEGGGIGGEDEPCPPDECWPHG